MKKIIYILTLIGVFSLTACGSVPQPWQRGTLAKESMILGGDPLGTKFDEHMYGSKEASSGGAGVGGGGCGCN